MSPKLDKKTLATPLKCNVQKAKLSGLPNTTKNRCNNLVVTRCALGIAILQIYKPNGKDCTFTFPVTGKLMQDTLEAQ